MTYREFLNEVLAIENLSDSIKEYGESALVKLDAKNANRSSKPTKTQQENEPLKASILELLADKKIRTASDVQIAIDLKSVQKASSLLRQLVAEGKVTQGETKIPKKGKVKIYSIADEGDAEITPGNPETSALDE